jgi:GNAT superfamily N-acetyltransferase
MHARDNIRIIEVIDALPVGLASLAALARHEGHGHLDRLIADWNSGAVRFDRPGEVLLIVYSGDELVGIGGLTIEPRLDNALRLRRFYVAPQRRGHGIGRMLAERLMRLAGSAEALTVNAGDEAAARFWERLGFARTEDDGFTHVRRLRGP